MNKKLIQVAMEISLYVAAHITYGYMLTILIINPFVNDSSLHESIHDQIFQAFIVMAIIGWLEKVIGGLS